MSGDLASNSGPSKCQALTMLGDLHVFLHVAPTLQILVQIDFDEDADSTDDGS